MSEAFFRTSNEQLEFEMKNPVSFAVAHTHKKSLGISLTRCVQDLREENYKTLMGETKEALNKRTDSPCSWIERLGNLRTSGLSNYIFSTAPKSQQAVLWVPAS